MSRGFWACIGAIAGFFVGGSIGHAIGLAQSGALGPGGVAELAGDCAALGSVIGTPCGFVIAWIVTSRAHRQR